MADESPGIVGKLPGRPLSVAEGQKLDDQESESSWVRPESIISRNGDQVVVALMAINRVTDHCWLLGYSPDVESWIVIDEWGYDDLEHDAFYARLEEWEAETFAGRNDWVIG